MSLLPSAGPLRHPAFAWYLASRGVNLLGTTAATVALAFAVLDLGGSTTALGQVLAARTLPMVALLLFGGVLADRLPRSLVLQASNLSSGLLQAATAALLLTGHAPLWAVVVLQALQGAATGVGWPAMAGMVPTLVPADELQRANALVSMTRGLTAVAGPSLGTLLVVTVGSGWAVLADAAAWFVAAVLLLPVRRSAPRRAPAERAGPRASTLVELREGWRLFRRTTWLWVVVAAFGVLNAIGGGAWLTLGPALAEDTIGRQAWGWALSAEAAGALLGTVALLRVRMPRPLLVGLPAVALLGLPMIALGLDARVLPLLVLTCVAGVGLEVFGMGWNLAVQENVPEAQLSRAYSYDALGSLVAMPVGQLVYGPLGDRFGVGPVVLWSGVAYVVIALLVLLSRSVRRLPRAPSPRTAADPATAAPG
ncbi:MFS transporter [Arthrobacter sp. NEB 688]|uniref:MFS transporter n=1 Tax=Arthrobacter sp. NEB 688 TaxID=904039 RepID=UPI001566A964|nr:MFS transporter [Arthrobacter sp. NEB 688]QKE83838.1 MFS transporter [Arthrobacter sp. NEB 688]